MSCGVDHRLSSNPALLWLWHSLAVAAPIQPLAWELPYAMGVTLKRQKQTNKKKKLNFVNAGFGTPMRFPSQRLLIDY